MSRATCLRAGPLAAALFGVAVAVPVRAQPSPPEAQPSRAEPPSSASEAAPAPVPAAPAPVSAAPAPVPPPALTPPAILRSARPEFPPARLASGEHPSVVLNVTVFSDGSTGDLTVEHSAGADFDEAALAAVRRWQFSPARRGDEAIASRVSVAVHFELPQLGVHDVTAIVGAVPGHAHAHGAAPGAPVPAPAPPSAYGADARVSAPAQGEDRGAADFRIAADVLHAAPAADGGELLKRAPGMVVARIEGDAVAQRLMLRGFDADHGQDIELTVDGVPLNQPSHIHGQGYADIGSVIPETVRSLRVTEGVYDPRQGDFAVAGSADFELGVEERGLSVASGYGSFRSTRSLVLIAPSGLRADSFAAASVKKSDGFGQNRASISGAAVGQLGFGTRQLRTVLHGSVYGVRGLTANVLRRDDIAGGRVGFYDVYPLATAEAQSGASQRVQLSARTRYHGDGGENGELTAYALVSTFRLQANYTGFAEISRTEPTWTGRGDLIEQLHEAQTLGMKARFRGPEQRPAAFLRGFYEVGVAGRFDRITQAQNLVQAPENSTWDRRIDADIQALDVGAYLDLDSVWFERLRVRGGLRADVLSYQVADRLQNFIPAFRAEEHLPGYRRSASGIALGPRVVAELRVLPPLALIAAYGEGFRSPMALLLDDGEPAPFAKVRSGDLGLKLELGAEHQLELRASAYATRLSADVAFDPREGSAQPVGPSLRLGGVVYAVLRPIAWLTSALSATYVHAALEEPPVSTAADPNPPFRRGQLLPYVPPVVLRADLAARHTLFDVRGAPLGGRLGLGFSYWSRRPLPFSERAAPVSLVDAELGIAYRRLTLSLSCLNVLDSEYAALELVYASSWDPSGFASRVPVRHVMAGAPRTFFLGLEVQL